MKAKVIVVTNRKGGVGKTTIATHLAAGLSLRPARVALVDTDAQGHCAVAFGMKKENGLYHLLCKDEYGFGDVVRPIAPERIAPPELGFKPELYLLPSDKATTLIPVENQNPFAFRQMLEAMSEALNLDYIIVDTGPTASLFDGSVNFAANFFVYVTELALMSFDGLNESIREMDRLNANNNRYRDWETGILGIVPNKVRLQTLSQRKKAEELFEHFREYIWPPIPLGTVWEDTASYGQMLYSLMPEAKETQIAYRMVNTALQRMNPNG